MDERALTERLITYDTSNVDGLRAAAGFIKGWLEAREIDVVDHKFGDLHALVLVDEVFEVDQLDRSDLQDRLKRAEEECQKAEEGTEELRAAEREKRRYEAFLKIADA